VKLQFLKCHFSFFFPEAYCEMLKDTLSTEEIKADTETLRKAYRGGDFPFADLDRKIVKIGGNKTSVTNNNHLPFTAFPVYPDAMGIVYIQNSKSSSGINKDPRPVIKNSDGDYWHQIAFVKCVREFYM